MLRVSSPFGLAVPGLLLAVLASQACAPAADSGPPDDARAPVDADRDGLLNDVDCDDADAEVTVGGPWYLDADADGHGVAETTTSGCSAPDGYVATAGDCDDHDAALNPGTPEVPYNGRDDDCASATPDDDLDGDGWVVDTYASARDCDDTNPSAHPGATEVCNGLDDDCNGNGDAGAVDILSWLPDDDADGYGDSTAFYQACEPASATDIPSNTTLGLDCDDTDAAVYPGAPEACGETDGADNDCDGLVDPACGSVQLSTEESTCWDHAGCSFDFHTWEGTLADGERCPDCERGWTIHLEGASASTLPPELATSFELFVALDDAGPTAWGTVSGVWQEGTAFGAGAATAAWDASSGALRIEELYENDATQPYRYTQLTLVLWPG